MIMFLTHIFVVSLSRQNLCPAWCLASTFPLISSTLYVAIYTRTLNTEPGIFNVFSAFLFGIGIILLG